MESAEKQSRARTGFRLAAGIISVGILTMGFPMSVVVAIRTDPSMWFVAFPSLVVGIGFATVVFTGRWLCFKRTHDGHKS